MNTATTPEYPLHTLNEDGEYFDEYDMLDYQRINLELKIGFYKGQHFERDAEWLFAERAPIEARLKAAGAL